MKELQKLGQEVILQSLIKAQKKYEYLKKIGDISGYELIENNFFKSYQELYLKFLENDDFNSSKQESEKIITEIIENLIKTNSLSKDYLHEQMKKRDELRGKSGAEAVKKLYEFQKKEFIRKKKKLLIKADEILREEFTLNEKLSNTIQFSEQSEIIEKLSPLRREFREIEKKIFYVEDLLKKIEEKLSKKWYYDIYGTMEEKELLESYHELFKEGEKYE